MDPLESKAKLVAGTPEPYRTVFPSASSCKRKVPPGPLGQVLSAFGVSTGRGEGPSTLTRPCESTASACTMATDWFDQMTLPPVESIFIREDCSAKLPAVGAPRVMGNCNVSTAA